MLQDIFIEQTVKRREAPMLRVIFYTGFTLMIINFLLGIIFLFPLFLLCGAMFLAVILWIRSNLGIEFDYNLTNGELDIARVRNGSKRKELVNIRQDDVIVMAPSHSSPVSQYVGSKMKTYDCTSHDAGMKYYVLIFKKEGNERKLLFEPDAELLDMLKRLNPRTVYKENEV